MKVYAIDLESRADLLTIYFDGVSIKQLTSNWYSQRSFSGANLCGNSGKEYYGAYFGGVAAHQSSQLTP